jgi:mycothiol system anti-sigma-R factor
MECIDCVKTAARLHLYLDRELSIEEISIVQQHLANCPVCECRFHVDMSIKRLLHECCALQRAPQRLRDAVLRIAHTPPHELYALDPELVSEMMADLDS